MTALEGGISIRVWNFNDSVRGRNLHSDNLRAVWNCFGQSIIKKIRSLQLYIFFSNLGYYFGKLIEAPLFPAGNASCCFWAILEKDCFDIQKNASKTAASIQKKASKTAASLQS